MTDKDFDRLISDALTSAEPPAALNEKLIRMAGKKPNKKAKIFTFVKTATAYAAAFVCAVAVLSYFNSDLFTEKDADITAQTNTVEEIADMMPDSGNETRIAAEVVPDSEKEKESLAPAKERISADIGQVSEVSAVNDAVAPIENGVEESTFSMKRVMPSPTFDTLFNEDYDYTAVISGKIEKLIAKLPYSQDVSFTGITGDEQIMLDGENVLTVVFAAGTIAPEEHGDLFFTVGTVQNGVLVE